MSIPDDGPQSTRMDWTRITRSRVPFSSRIRTAPLFKCRLVCLLESSYLADRKMTWCSKNSTLDTSRLLDRELWGRTGSLPDSSTAAGRSRTCRPDSWKRGDQLRSTRTDSRFSSRCRPPEQNARCCRTLEVDERDRFFVLLLSTTEQQNLPLLCRALSTWKIFTLFLQSVTLCSLSHSWQQFPLHASHQPAFAFFPTIKFIVSHSHSQWICNQHYHTISNTTVSNSREANTSHFSIRW